MNENIVQFNLKNVHYAVITDMATATFETPVHHPGAVQLNLDQEGEISQFYADGITYYQCAANDGYKGSLEMARFMDKMRKDIWGYEETEDKVLMERSDVQPKAFALLFQIDGDADNELYCMYNCSATRPGVGSQTTTGTKTPNTQSSEISAKSLPNGYVMARTGASTPKEVKNNWFKQVYLPKTVETQGA